MMHPHLSRSDEEIPLPLSQLMSEPQRSRLTIRQERGNLYYGIDFHYMKNELGPLIASL
jgi:hypothetical protein